MFLAFRATSAGNFLVVGIITGDLPLVTPGHSKYGEPIQFGYDCAMRNQHPVVDVILPLLAATEADLLEMLPKVMAEIDQAREEFPHQREGGHDDLVNSAGGLNDLASAARRISELEHALATEREFGQMILSGGSLSNMTTDDLPADGDE